MKRCIKILKRLLWNISQAIISLFRKRDKSIVLFGSWFGKRFADNPRYLFEYLHENKEKLGLTHVVWVTLNEDICREMNSYGYECYMMHSKESVYYHKKAGIHMICNGAEVSAPLSPDIMAKYSVGAKKVNLWHGMGGIKGVNFASREYLKAKEQHPALCAVNEWLRRRTLYRKLAVFYGGWGDCYYLSTTPFETDIMKKYFLLPDSRFIESGFPRNNRSLHLMKREEDAVASFRGYDKIIGYFPTFREDNSNYVYPLSDKRLRNMLVRNNWLWVEKKHSYDKSEILSDGGDGNILRLDSEFDLNIIIRDMDLIITDYSSVSWDALYHRLPVVYYMPDYEYYMNQDRGLVLKPEEFLIGPATYSTEQLYQTLSAGTGGFDALLLPNEDDIFKKVWGEEKSCAEIWDDITAFIGYKDKK